MWVCICTYFLFLTCCPHSTGVHSKYTNVRISCTCNILYMSNQTMHMEIYTRDAKCDTSIFKSGCFFKSGCKLDYPEHDSDICEKTHKHFPRQIMVDGGYPLSCTCWDTLAVTSPAATIDHNRCSWTRPSTRRRGSQRCDVAQLPHGGHISSVCTTSLCLELFIVNTKRYHFSAYTRLHHLWIYPDRFSGSIAVRFVTVPQVRS